MSGSSGVGGLSFRAIRNALRQLKLQRPGFDPAGVLRRHAKLTPSEAERCVAVLLEAGLIEAVPDGDGAGYALTNEGSRYATKRLRRISKKRKDELIQSVTERIKRISDDPTFAFEVDKVVLFGSTLRDDLPDYGDVDIAYSIAFKRSYPNLLAALNAEQDFTGISYLDLPRGHPQFRIEKFLKGRSPFVHLHGLDGFLRSGDEYRELYQRPLP